MKKSKRKFFVAFFFAISFPFISIAQTAGCTDPLAQNYNQVATINDGSCIYNTTFFSPQNAFELPGVVNETSGLLYYAGKLWSFNDSGGAAKIYAIDTITKLIVQQVSISNGSNIDWEDIAMDDTYIYVGDFGNNSGTRDDLVIYRIQKSLIPASGNVTVSAEKINFSYPDQKTFAKSKNHNFDCESIISAGDFLFLFSKNRGDQQSKLYQIPKTPGTHVASLLDSFNSNGLITGADFDANSNEVVLTGYTQNTYLPFLWILFDFDGKDFFGGNKRRIELTNLAVSQIEGVVFVALKRTFISSETTLGGSARVYRFSTSNWTSDVSSTLENEDNQQLKVLVNPITNNLLRLQFGGNLHGESKIEITDSIGRIVLQQVKSSESINNKIVEININTLKSGRYFVTIINNRKKYTVTFIQL